MIDLDAIWRAHAESVGMFGTRPNFRFDPQHYAAQVQHFSNDSEALALHYWNEGKAQGLTPTFYVSLSKMRSSIDGLLANLVVDSALSAAIASGHEDACHLACELILLGAPVDAEVSDFSMSAYLNTHPDIERAAMNPLLHYLLNGASEGRKTLGDLRRSQYHGKCAYSPKRPTCLIAVHEFSRTGAPIVGLDLVREAARTHNVVVVALKGGELLDLFREYSCEVIVTERPLTEFEYFRGEVLSRIEFAITNSVECYVFTPFLVARGIPFAAYVHEYTDYTFPFYKSTFASLMCDLLVFSSEHVRDNWAGRLRDIEFNIERDTLIVPQRAFAISKVQAQEISKARDRLSRQVGRDLSDVRLICGAGHLQWRKGTDIFAMTAQIARHRDPDTVFLWIGDGLNFEDVNFGAWMTYHLRQIGADDPAGNLFFLPAGPAYLDVMAASDAMFISSRLDPLPNVVFDALDNGCRVVQFTGASGFGDSLYQASDHFISVEYGNPDAAARAILSLPRKEGSAEETSRPQRPKLFSTIRDALKQRLKGQRYFVRGSSQINVPMLFPEEDDNSPLRLREREKMFRYGRRLIWRDLDDVRLALDRSDNWIHRNVRLAPFGVASASDVPDFSMHVHAYYTDELALDLQKYRAFQHARRIVVTTDTDKKADEIRTIMRAEGLEPEIVLVKNRGRDILPFMDLFRECGSAGDDEIWCHLHQKKSLNTTKSGDIWRQFLLRILLGNESELSDALTTIARPEIGLVAPFDPYYIAWNASRNLLPKFANRLPGPMPGNPLLFPIGNMFWVKRPVVLAMNAVFGDDYLWPNEPIANDGTEFHLIERLWPAMSTHLDLESVFVHKLDEKRV